MKRNSGLQAVILAGGLGTRLREAISDRPKAMANMGSKPFLEHQVEYLKSAGIDELIFCVGYLHEQIQHYFGDGSHWGVHIEYSVEEQLLGTAGALKLAENYIQGTFLAMNGDSFLDVDLNALALYHDERKTGVQAGQYVGTLALTKVEDARNFGLTRVGQNGLIESFVEKAANSTAGSNGYNLINAGIYVLERELMGFIPAGTIVSIEREVFPKLLEVGYQLGGYIAKGLFVDIGTPAGYRRFQEYIEARQP